MQTVKEKQTNIFRLLKDKFGYKNAMQAPRVLRVVVNVGVGSIKDKTKAEIIPDRLMKITGQKPSQRGAKKSIATFKVRHGDIIGYMVTLRGARMNTFIDKLINVVLPRTRDFKGISRSAIDDMGNLTIGIKEHTIFPETSDEELKNVFGMSISFVTNTNDKKAAEEFFEHLGVPFHKK